MKKGKWLSGKWGILSITLVAALLIGATSAVAVPIDLNNVKVGYSAPVYDGFYARYKFTADEFEDPADAVSNINTFGASGTEFEDPLTAFCVDSTLLDLTNPGYKMNTLDGFLAVNPNDQFALAAKYADHFFQGNNFADQSAYQVAIWNTLEIKELDNSSLASAAQSIIDLEWENYQIKNSLVIAYSDDSQNYLRRMSVPEPTTMLLFGTGLLAFAGLGRKRLLKK